MFLSSFIFLFYFIVLGRLLVPCRTCHMLFFLHVVLYVFLANKMIKTFRRRQWQNNFAV